MPYNDLDHTWIQLRQNGFDVFAEDLLSELEKPVKVPYSRDITFDDPSVARKLLKLLYELLSNYPQHKPKISLAQFDNTVRVKITDREERRGRRPKCQS